MNADSRPERVSRSERSLSAWESLSVIQVAQTEPAASSSLELLGLKTNCDLNMIVLEAPGQLMAFEWLSSAD